jgi:hypothetical protein
MPLWLAWLQLQALEKGATFGNKTLPMVWYMPTAASLAAAKSSAQQQVPLRSVACIRAGLAFVSPATCGSVVWQMCAI